MLFVYKDICLISLVDFSLIKPISKVSVFVMNGISNLFSVCSVNTSGSVMWGSIPLMTLCRNWLVMDRDGKDGDGGIAEMFDDTLHVELFPSRLQVILFF